MLKITTTSKQLSSLSPLVQSACPVPHHQIQTYSLPCQTAPGPKLSPNILMYDGHLIEPEKVLNSFCHPRLLCLETLHVRDASLLRLLCIHCYHLQCCYTSPTLRKLIGSPSNPSLQSRAWPRYQAPYKREVLKKL